MKHIMLSGSFTWSTEPFPAFRCELVYGRNKHDRAFLPVKNITPVVMFTVSADSKEIYQGTDEVLARNAKTNYEQEKKEAGQYGYAQLTQSQPTLPEGNFKVIKTKEKGTILVVPGEDTTNRCFLFVGCTGGFRGGETVLEDGTTGTILKNCSAGNACDSSTEVIVLLEVGQAITYYSYGRRTDDVFQYTWDGSQVIKKSFSKEEWDNRNSSDEKESEVL